MDLELLIGENYLLDVFDLAGIIVEVVECLRTMEADEGRIPIVLINLKEEL